MIKSSILNGDLRAVGAENVLSSNPDGSKLESISRNIIMEL